MRKMQMIKTDKEDMIKTQMQNVCTSSTWTRTSVVVSSKI